MENTHFLSISDYLGKTPGDELCAEVKRVADENSLPFKIVENPDSNHKGIVYLYSHKFLEFQFRKPIT